MIELEVRGMLVIDFMKEYCSRNMQERDCPYNNYGTLRGCKHDDAECNHCCNDAVRDWIQGYPRSNTHCGTCTNACGGVKYAMKTEGVIE